jgi:hypothetical protein
MVVAGKSVFIVGSKGLLEVRSAEDGNKIDEMKIGKTPIWDGLAAANGRLYLAGADGEVVCLGQ